MRDREKESRGFSGTTGLGIGVGLGVPVALPPPGAGTTIMTTMTSMTTMRPGIGSAQCRQPPAYKVAAQMARLHRLGRAHSHEGVTYRNDHEDGTKANTIATYNTIYSTYPRFSRHILRTFLYLYEFMAPEVCVPYHYRR